MAKKDIKSNKEKNYSSKVSLGGFSKLGSSKPMSKFTKFIKNKLLTKKGIVITIILLIVSSIALFLLTRPKAPVETVKVERGKVNEELVLSGKISAEKYVSLYFPASGKLSWVGVVEGQWVKKGQALSSIDSTTLDAAYQQALNMSRKYMATVESVHDSLKNKEKTETFAEKDTRTSAEATNDYYYNALRAAEYNLKNATLYAPFEGLISYIGQTAPGVNIQITEAQIGLIDPKTIYFEVSADQSEIINLKLDQEVKVVLDSFTEEELPGKVTFISYTPQVGESGAVYKIKIKFETEEADQSKFRVGMTGDAKFILAEKENVLYVPSKFVHSDKKGKYVNLNKKGNKVYIETGIEGEDQVEITGNIKEGDTLYD